ncbi:hypothetical protein CCR75_004063 [Bremia lactucae]|uniref:B-block binding subunit of TFIIIC domain-containing protein n=1 Tax=Bremia lactucae TaxID=4779 RepID=A0A976IBA2_BRELC|nr:hypothetical protein CCR75_004063 [Bremia lactucae]
MTCTRTPRELVAACMDHIALEGNAGISIALLFSRIEPSNDVSVRRQVWRLLRSCCGVLRFFRCAVPVHTPSKKRKRVELLRDSDDPTAMALRREVLESVVSSLSIEYPTLTVDELALLKYEDINDDQNGMVIVIACKELRHRALNIPVKAIAADLGPDHFGILEAVGHARIKGVTVTTLTNHLSGGTVKRLHNCLDTLISCGLVVKRMMIVAKPTMRRLNIIHLPRFAAKFRPQMYDESAGFESDEQSRKILCAAAKIYIKGLPTQSSVLSDLGRDLCLQKRHLEVLRSQITQECKVDDNYPLELFQAVLQPSRSARIEPKILNCVRYKPFVARKNSAFRRGIILELGLLRQIFETIKDSAEKGTTIIDLRKQLVLPGTKLPYKMMGVLAGMYSLKAESIILGKNKAFRLYLESTAPIFDISNSNKEKQSVEYAENCLLQASQPRKVSNDDNEEAIGIMRKQAFPLRATKALKDALGAEVEGTSTRRREHILDRLEDEKIISLSSLRDSVFSMEKQRAGMKLFPGSEDSNSENYRNVNCLMSPAAVGKVDTRSIFRIAMELEHAKKLRLLQLPLPARNVSTKFRALRCIVAPGYEHNDVFIQGFVKNYCRDERLRRIYRNADQNEVVCFHKSENEKDYDIRHWSSRKIVRTSLSATEAKAGVLKEVILKSSDGREGQAAKSEVISQSLVMKTKASKRVSCPRREISYRIRRFISQHKSGIHSQQYRKLGFAYGVMYRCKALHRFLFDALHEKNGSNFHLSVDRNISSAPDLNDDVSGDTYSASPPDKVSLSGIVFSRESVLHSMPVHLYIQIFSGGEILTDEEFLIIEKAVAHQRSFKSIPLALRDKIWCHESQRTAKVLGTLADLGLVQPHKIGMKHLVKILRAGYTDGRDGVLARALKDNALGGLFRFNKQTRIMLDVRENGAGEVQAETKLRGVNALDSIQIVGFTKKSYSFANTLPLQFTFRSGCDVNRFWEALECLCLEQMAMEVESPRKNESSVSEIPKPVKTRARRMFRILAWIPKSQKPVAKHKWDEIGDKDKFKSSGIVSTSIRPRTKRRLAEYVDERNYEHEGVKRKQKKKSQDMTDAAPSKVEALTWTDTHEQHLVKYFIENCRSRWKIPIPQGLQRDNELVAFRNHKISRTGFGLVTIARKLGKRKIDVKKRLKEKLLEPTVKLQLEIAKREAEISDNPTGLFDEELAIQESTRLTALFRRAVTMIVSPREEYYPLVAEELISFWAPHEVRLVWRYLWLKNWIVRASDKERGRGYCTSKRLQDSLKVTTLSFPLILFQQAAEQESMVSSTIEEVVGDSNDPMKPSTPLGELRNCDHLFEDDFPTNATPGQCALELGCQVLGTCSFRAVYTSTFSTDLEFEGALETHYSNDKRLSTSNHEKCLFTSKSLKDKSGFAAHLANKVTVTRASDSTDSWRVKIKMHAVNIEGADKLRACEAFSIENAGDTSVLKQATPSAFNESDNKLSDAILILVRGSGEEGLTLISLIKQLCVQRQFERESRFVVRSLDSLVDQGELVAVNAYYDQRYVVKEHGDMWMLRPYYLAPSVASSSTPHIMFEEHKKKLSFPWLKMDGRINYTFFFSLQRKLLALILQAPGITEQRAYTKMNKLLSLQDIREAMSLLVEEGLAYARAVTRSTTARATIFSYSWSTQPLPSKVIKLAGNVLTYDRSNFQVHYFPHVQCIQRFGSIVQDYQNEVYQND